MKTFFYLIIWLPVAALVWFQSAGLLQSHGVIRGTGFWCDAFNHMPWWSELLLIILAPAFIGCICGFIIYILVSFIISLFKG